MATLYVIPNWERDFENNKSRAIENPTWMPVQNHFDGKRINRIKKLSRSLEKYGAFHVIAAIASRCEYRGVLLDNDGPVGPLEIADKTGFPVKELAAAFEELSAPMIGLLEKHEIVQNEKGEWPLPDAVRRWAIHRSWRRQRKTHGDNHTPQGAAESHEPSRAQQPPNPPKTPPPNPPKPPPTPRDTSPPPSAAEGREGSRREGKGTEVPSAVSLDRETTSHADNGMLITEPSVAKRLICKEILGGKDPNRDWSYDAQHRLSELCSKEKPMPLAEIRDVARFRAIPKSDDVPELKRRVEPVTETGLMNYWGDEVQRAREYFKKYQSNRNGSAGKKNPLKWREFFAWKHGDDTLNFPDHFEQLDRAQQDEYDRDFQTFVIATAKPEELAAP